MGLYALGTTENVDTFFRVVGEKAKIAGLSIDPKKGLEANEKSFIKKEFIRLIGGENIFKPDPDFTRQEGMDDITKVREKLATAHEGVFRQEPPYITPNGIELLVRGTGTEVKNTL